MLLITIKWSSLPKSVFNATIIYQINLRRQAQKHFSNRFLS
jgi:hypothetical protein